MGLELGTAALIYGAVSGVGSIASGIIGSNAAKDAAETQNEAMERAAKLQRQTAKDNLAFQKQQYGQARSDIAPWRQAGITSLGDLMRIQGVYEDAVLDPSSYQESPEFAWLKEQGIDALQRGAAASGKLDSGQNQKDLVKYGQGMALQGRQSYLGNLQSLMNRYGQTAGAGQSAGSSMANLAGQHAGAVGNIQSGLGANLGNLYSSMGQASAQGIIGGANAWGNAMQNLSGSVSGGLDQYMMGSYIQDYLNRGGGLANAGQAGQDAGAAYQAAGGGGGIPWWLSQSQSDQYSRYEHYDVPEAARA